MNETASHEFFQMRLQTIQDYLSETLGIFVELIEEDGTELMLPSGLPAICQKQPLPACETCYEECIAESIEAPDRSYAMIRCACGLACAVFPTAITYNFSRVFVCFGRVDDPVQIEGASEPIEAFFSLPISFRANWELLKQTRKDGEDGLTDKEREVLGYLVEGLSNKRIASTMYVSESTVKTHVSHILTKLRAKNRSEAVSIAIKQNLLADAQ